MIEVTDQNFEILYPKIEETLKNATFFSMDTEFSGIKTDFFVKESLFDSPNERYAKLKNNIKPFIIIQFGLTAFQHVREQNTYNAQTFSFYLLPRSIPSKNRHFLWQITSLEFLSIYKFDFNKFAYDGISYLNEVDEIDLKNNLQEDILMQNLERLLCNRDADELKNSRNVVADWLIQKIEPPAVLEIVSESQFLQYLMEKELRNQFPDIWTYSGKKTVTVMRIGKDERQELELKEKGRLEEKLLNYYIGFSKVFKLLVKLKKPIVGHNSLVDLMYMHQQFYKPLPKKYTIFKKNIHELFPTVFDTKFLSYEIRNFLKKEEKFSSNSLNTLYYYFKNEKGRFLSLHSPKICSETYLKNDEDKFHDAGWDSYCAGYCFIRLAHIFAAKKRGEGSNYKPMTNIEILNGVKSFSNRINIIRGNVPYLNFGGPDPVSERPQWLVVQPKGSKTFCVSEIAELLSSYGSVDVKPFNSRYALVAVSNHRSARDILQHFKSHAEIQILFYNPVRHSTKVKIFCWSSLIISGCIISLILHRRS
ncbi:pre-piRNA 3'-exonuclease trimmer-like [Leptopilina boulardi]|uniref:pre-piRNA 3'-exonuclease trimmer-like n=1 Tax=Leptopilina boulardi TaxID=63433 RepID=UPI0021F662DD|nr:pre-piRNA 3'-exonuclease trimmer-like [Leptopilina boulardi]